MGSRSDVARGAGACVQGTYESSVGSTVTNIKYSIVVVRKIGTVGSAGGRRFFMIWDEREPRAPHLTISIFLDTTSVPARSV